MVSCYDMKSCELKRSSTVKKATGYPEAEGTVVALLIRDIIFSLHQLCIPWICRPSLINYHDHFYHDHPPSPGFTPASQQPVQRRELFDEQDHGILEERAATTTTCRVQSGKVVISPSVYPSKVACAGLVKIIVTTTKVATASTTRTISYIPNRLPRRSQSLALQPSPRVLHMQARQSRRLSHPLS